jgi:hypothetical protein
LGEAAVVDAAEVGVVEVGGEVALEAGEADVEVAGEGGPPAFLVEGPVERFYGAVGLRAAGADQRVAGAESGECGAEPALNEPLIQTTSPTPMILPSAVASSASWNAHMECGLSSAQGSSAPLFAGLEI